VPVTAEVKLPVNVSSGYFEWIHLVN
jgi:hypothetical protein